MSSFFSLESQEKSEFASFFFVLGDSKPESLKRESQYFKRLFFHLLNISLHHCGLNLESSSSWSFAGLALEELKVVFGSPPFFFLLFFGWYFLC